MVKTPIFITSFHRRQFTERCVREIQERTEPGSYDLHLYDNDCMANTEDREFALSLLESGRITSLMLDSRNTGCLYNKGVFHMMAETTDGYYVVTDNDVFPPSLSPDWLSQMRSIMDRHPKLGLLAMQLPPQHFQRPTGKIDEDVVYCRAVGNTYKMVRRAAFPLQAFKPGLMTFGDDGTVSVETQKIGWDVAFCWDIWCFHAGQCVNWGYRDEEIAQDPRKAGYGKPFVYEFEDEEKYVPKEPWVSMGKRIALMGTAAYTRAVLSRTHG